MAAHVFRAQPHDPIHTDDFSISCSPASCKPLSRACPGPATCTRGSLEAIKTTGDRPRTAILQLEQAYVRQTPAIHAEKECKKLMEGNVNGDSTALQGKVVDLRSDTVTRPTPAMRAAMAEAPVGDDVAGEDPTVNALQDRAAVLFEKEAALFVPSGTMANLLAVLAQTRPGDAVILSGQAHPFQYESGNLAMVAGVLPHTVPGESGILEPDRVEPYIHARPRDHHLAPTTLISIENTTNRGGGAIYPIETAQAMAQLARKYDIKLHCDGARIFNAVVETGISPATYAAHTDTLCFCLSKGLGAPVGSVLLGDAATIEKAHRFRKMLGGGMRQAGIMAAAGLYALGHHVDRLREDHRRARYFREQLLDTPGLSFDLPAPTNMVYV
ncbi:MAG TPA: low specificity L-threonine aldolase, partial [Candidatus Hydrogenedentes bacterium]|nr:low specificity L-threonine aldolase [Candidatus Hydrogenedentota bacterium]